MREEKFPIEKFYAFCEVHFDRSVCRVSRIHAVVPSQRKKEFRDKVAELKRTDISLEEFYATVDYLQTEFPKCKNWLGWYLHPNRGKSIFPALATVNFAGTVHNTNAQESMGRTIQMTCEQTKPNIAQLYFHLFKLACKFDMEYSCVSMGEPTRYGKVRKKQSRANDGRPPDTTEALLGSQRRKKVGRPRNTRNVTPSGKDAVDLTTAIPWSFETHDDIRVQVSNTCALDTSLQALYLLRRYDQDLYLHFKGNKLSGELNKVLDMIQAEDYNGARLEWIMHSESTDHIGYRKLAKKSTKTDDNGTMFEYWDCFGTLQEQIDVIPSFVINFCHEYDGCSNKDANCDHWEHYSGNENSHANRPQHIKHASVYLDEMHDMQKLVFDIFYNDFGEKVDCGVGTKISRNTDGKYEFCNGSRMMKKQMIGPPPALLLIEPKARVWDNNSRVSKLTALEKIEHLLIIEKIRYQLVQVMLCNGSHFCGVTLLHGKYLFYDGMSTKKLHWIADSVEFKSLGNFVVEALWYKSFIGLDDDKDQTQSSTAKVGDDWLRDVISQLQTHSTVPIKRQEVEFTDDGSDYNDPQYGIHSDEEDDKFSPPKRKRKIKEHTSLPKKISKAGKKYKMGISITTVGKRGVQPVCQYCLSKIGRGVIHTVKKTGQADKNWNDTGHYHFNCFDPLSPIECEQLLKIVSMSEEVSDAQKKDLEDEMNYSNRVRHRGT